jgi:hypothetical protein
VVEEGAEILPSQAASTRERERERERERGRKERRETALGHARELYSHSATHSTPGSARLLASPGLAQADDRLTLRLWHRLGSVNHVLPNQELISN